jgi:hypothetical protein
MFSGVSQRVGWSEVTDVHLQGQAKALRSLDMSLTACQFTRCNVLEDSNVNGKACLCPEYAFFDRVTGWTKVRKV